MSVIKSDLCFRKKKKNMQEIIRLDRIRNQCENYEAIQSSGQVMKRICFFFFLNNKKQT